MEPKMFCINVRKPPAVTGCTQIGVCGKTPQVAAMQDLLVWNTKGLAAVTTQLRKEQFPVSKEV